MKKVRRKVRRRKVEVIIRKDGVVGWCSELRKLGFECPLGREVCERCFCG